MGRAKDAVALDRSARIAAKLRETLPVERKVVQLGNSVGITLPKAVDRFGMRVGSRVRITYVKETGFYVEPIRPRSALRRGASKRSGAKAA